MSRGRPSTALTAILVTMAGGLTVGTAGAQASSAAAAPRHSTLKFGACPASTGAPPHVYCASLKVPLDYAHPQGKQITLTVSAIGDADAPRAMIVNPGGPGAPGVGTEQLVWTGLPQKVGEQEEVFSFDPRGVGASTPISCGNLAKEAPLAPTPYRPRNAADLHARKVQAKRIADSCAAHARTMLATMNTVTEARDMDRVRQAIGADRVDYLGYSAGTDLGATYETLFPSHVGRAVLDSVVDPTVSEYAAGFEQDTGFQGRTDQFFDWVAKRDKSYHLGRTRAAVEKTWAGVRAQLDAHPAGGKFGSSALDDIQEGGMYVAATWGNIAQVVAAYRKGDSSGLITAAKGAGAGQADIGLLAYTCNASGWPKSWATWEKDTRRADRTAPSIAWLNTWSSAPCLYWPVHAKNTVRVGSVKVPPTLLLEPEHDPATPLIGAQRMRRVLTTTRLLVNGGGDHASYLLDKDPCTDTQAEKYWLTGVLPKDGTCPVPQGDV